jgi:hypothetical protein
MFLGPHKSAVEPGGGSPPPQAAPAVSAPPAGNGSAAAPPAASPDQSEGFKQLRGQYETTKAERDRWAGLGNYDDVSKVYQAHSQRISKAVEMGKALGYEEARIRQAMEDDPKGTIDFLNQKFQQPTQTSREDMNRQLKEMLEAEVKPIRQQLDDRANQDAENLYHGERDRLLKSEFPDGLPDSAREMLFEILDSLVSQDSAALGRLKFQKQTSDVARHFATAKTTLLKRFNDYEGFQRKREPIPGGKKADPNEGVKYSDRKISSAFGGGTVKDLIGKL